MSNREWLNKDLSFAIRHYKAIVHWHPALGDRKKVIRGLRRRRNWLMRQGQWPTKKRTDLKGELGPLHGFDFADEKKISYVEVVIPGIKL